MLFHAINNKEKGSVSCFPSQTETLDSFVLRRGFKGFFVVVVVAGVGVGVGGRNPLGNVSAGSGLRKERRWNDPIDSVPALNSHSGFL